jgi:putative transposase
MARGPRLDAPGALHHVRARGIERRPIFEDDADREDFLNRLACLVEERALKVFAWALMPNHVHLLVQTGAQALHRSMRALLAGYASRFNRRHDRAGHLFQNRYKSTLCDDDTYFLKLVHYVHLNPVPSVVPDVGMLAGYAWTGHATLLGALPRPWQETTAVLDRFAQEPVLARVLYEKFIREGIGERAPNLDGGGLVRGQTGWRYVRELRRGREQFTSNERILGVAAFVDRTLTEIADAPPRRISLEDLVERVCDEVGIAREALVGLGRQRAVSRARRGIAYLWTLQLGGSGRELAVRFGVSPSAVHQSARQGLTEARRWGALLKGRHTAPGQLHKL